MNKSTRLLRLADELDRLAWMSEQYNLLAMLPTAMHAQTQTLIDKTRARAQRIRRHARTMTTNHRN